MNFPGPAMLLDSAKLSRAAVGSDPGDSTNSRGVLLELSAYAAVSRGACVRVLVCVRKRVCFHVRMCVSM